MGTARALVALSAVSWPACKDNVSKPYVRLLLSAIDVFTPLTNLALRSSASIPLGKHHDHAENQAPHRLHYYPRLLPGQITSALAPQEKENPNEYRLRAPYFVSGLAHLRLRDIPR